MVLSRAVKMDWAAYCPGDDVAVDRHFRRVVVKIDPPGVMGRYPAAFFQAEAVHVVEEVVGDYGSARREPIAPARVHRTRVSGFQVQVPAVIELDAGRCRKKMPKRGQS